jgi:arabinogalactan endo-1,4-beta-galactosidase
MDIDPMIVYFTFSRIRPFFSCGRPIQETLDALIKGEVLIADLPSIQLLFDGKNYFSLNNRRLYVFKTLKQAGLIEQVRARVKPVPQTKRMKTKYTIDKCSLTAKLMREGEKSPER